MCVQSPPAAIARPQALSETQRTQSRRKGRILRHSVRISARSLFVHLLCGVIRLFQGCPQDVVEGVGVTPRVAQTRGPARWTMEGAWLEPTASGGAPVRSGGADTDSDPGLPAGRQVPTPSGRGNNRRSYRLRTPREPPYGVTAHGKVGNATLRSLRRTRTLRTSNPADPALNAGSETPGIPGPRATTRPAHP